jgi:hypothetical protein
MYPTLDFPPISCKYKQVNNNVYIFDRVRKKFILLTPEEWVRQHLMGFLIDCKKYPASLLRIESGLRYNRMLKRTDLTVYDRNGHPLIIFECKSAEHNLDQPDLLQLSVYGKSLKPYFLGLTNGLRHFIWKMNYKENISSRVHGFPEYGELISAIGNKD